MFIKKIKISCVTVSIGRFKYLTKVIKCFNQQTFPYKELFVITNEAERTRCFVRSMRNVVVPGVDPNLNAGQMKNIGCELATGQFICNWEDDALYHPRRLTSQFQYLLDRKLDAVLYSDCLRYFPYYGYLYWIKLGNNQKYKDRSFVQPSIMFRKDLFLNRQRLYDESGERNTDEFLVKDLIADGKMVKGMPDRGYQYLQVCDGSKPPLCDHHFTDTRITGPLNEEEMFARKDCIDEMLEHLSISTQVKTGGKNLWKK